MVYIHIYIWCIYIYGIYNSLLGLSLMSLMKLGNGKEIFCLVDCAGLEHLKSYAETIHGRYRSHPTATPWCLLGKRWAP